MKPIDWVVAADPRAPEDVEELAAVCSGAEVGRALAAMASHPASTVRAAVGYIVVTAVECADAEVQSCGGQFDDQGWLEGLVVGAPEGSRELYALLDDPSAEVRAAALMAFAALLEARAQPWMRRFLDAWTVDDVTPLWSAVGDAAPSVRVAALAAVRHLPREVDAPLRERLDDPDAAVREAAVPAAVAHWGRGVEERLAALASDPGERAGEAAAQALVDLDSPRAAGALAARLRGGSPTEGVLTWLAEAPSCAVEPAEIAAFLAPARPRELRIAAARALTRWGGRGCEEALVSAVRLGDHAAIYAAIALARRPTPGSESALAAATRDPLPALERYSQSAVMMLRDAAARALGTLGTAEARARLLDAPVSTKGKGSPRGPHAKVLAQSLGFLASADVALQIDRLIDADIYAARVGAVALGLSGAAKHAPRLRKWLAHRDERLRTHAALGLALLPVALPREAARALASPAKPVAATYETEALAVAAGMRRLAERGHRDRAVLTAALAWCRAHRLEVDAMVACFRRRGRASGYGMAYVWMIDDWLREATAGLEARVGA
ncbi:MAG: hypothetical protein KC486_29765 [Myxococcales bacterium]|nr:hypothetical protein [Myxococcales bacterium]